MSLSNDLPVLLSYIAKIEVLSGVSHTSIARVLSGTDQMPWRHYVEGRLIQQHPRLIVYLKALTPCIHDRL